MQYLPINPEVVDQLPRKPLCSPISVDFPLEERSQQQCPLPPPHFLFRRWEEVPAPPPAPSDLGQDVFNCCVYVIFLLFRKVR